MRYVMRIFDTPLLEFEASYGEGLQACLSSNKSACRHQLI